MASLFSVQKWASIALVALLLLAGACALRPGASFSAQDRLNPAAEPSRLHPAGTDALGRDRLTRVAAGTLLGFTGATAAAALTTGLAALVGMSAALSPRLLSAPLLLASDLFLSLPWLFLLMMVRAGLPLSASPLFTATVTFLLLGLLGWPAAAHAVHAGTQRLMGSAWLLQARASGLSTGSILRHLAPQLGPLLLPQFLLSIPAFLMAEANLGTLGLGVGEPLPSWGSMLAELESSALLLGGSHWALLPVGVLLVSLALLQLRLGEV